MRKKMLFYIGLAIYCLISLFFLNNQEVQADHYEGHVHNNVTLLVKLNNQMLELYETSNSANKIAAYQGLQSIKSNIKTNDAILKETFEHWYLFEEELIRLEHYLTSRDDNRLWKESISRLLLASDAMLQGDEGPWREYEGLMLERIRQMESSFINQEAYRATTMQANLTILEEQIERVSLAAQLVGNKRRLEELQFRVVDLQAFMLSMSLDQPQQMTYYSEVEKSIRGLKQTTLSLFENTTSVLLEPVDVRNAFPIQMGLILALLISGILAYVSFRKYKQVPYGVKKI